MWCDNRNEQNLLKDLHGIHGGRELITNESWSINSTPWRMCVCVFASFFGSAFFDILSTITFSFFLFFRCCCVGSALVFQRLCQWELPFFPLCFFFLSFFFFIGLPKINSGRRYYAHRRPIQFVIRFSYLGGSSVALAQCGMAGVGWVCSSISQWRNGGRMMGPYNLLLLQQQTDNEYID